MSDTHRDLVAAGYLRRGVSRPTIARRTGLSFTAIVAIAGRLRIADDTAARSVP